MITAVLGAPGSGKSALAALLVPLLPGHAVLDWDCFMDAAAALAGRDIRQHPETWSAYRQLVRTVLSAVAPLPVVLFTVCTPDELPGWPIDAWLLVDCTDQEGRRRLSQQALPQWPDEGVRVSDHRLSSFVSKSISHLDELLSVARDRPWNGSCRC